MRAARRWGRNHGGVDAGRWPLAVAGALVLVPALVAAVRAVRWGWVPVGDQATVAIRSLDVLSSHPPRLGQLSGVSAQAGHPTRSLGPMGYWPFALPARWGPLWGPAVVAAAVSGAAMVASVRLAVRRGGTGLALAVAAGLVLTARAVNPATLASTWNPAVGTGLVVLLVLLCWSVGVGETRLLPVTVLVASACAQVHSVLILPTAAALAVGAVGLVAVRARIGWRAGLASAAVAVVCWALPVLDQVTGDPGNMSRLRGVDLGEPSGAPITGRVLADAVGVVPAFLGPDRPPMGHAAVLQHAPGRVALVSAVLVVVGLIAVAARAARRRDVEVALGPALVVAVLGAGLAAVWLTPGAQFLVLTYTTWWLVPVGMLAWVLLGWGVLRERAVPWPERAAPVALAVAGVVLVAVAVLAPARAEPEEPIHAQARTVGDAVAARVTAGGRYRVESTGTTPSELVAATAYRVRRAGARPVVAGNDGIGAGHRYVPVGRRCRAVVTLGRRGAPVPPGAEVLAEVVVPAHDEPAHTVWVAMGPDGGGPSC